LALGHRMFRSEGDMPKRGAWAWWGEVSMWGDCGTWPVSRAGRSMLAASKRGGAMSLA